MDKPRMNMTSAPATIHPIRFLSRGALGAVDAVDTSLFAIEGLRPYSSSSLENVSRNVSAAVSVVASRVGTDLAFAMADMMMITR